MTGMLQIRISSLPAADAPPGERGHPLLLRQRRGNLHVLIESKLMSAAFKCQGCGNTASSCGMMTLQSSFPHMTFADLHFYIKLLNELPAARHK